jgi:hypothetical protein
MACTMTVICGQGREITARGRKGNLERPRLDYHGQSRKKRGEGMRNPLGASMEGVSEASMEGVSEANPALVNLGPTEARRRTPLANVGKSSRV